MPKNKIKLSEMSGVNKKQYYQKRANYNKPKFYLEAGQRGFFCTCNFREKDCVKEAYNLLEEYGNKLYGSSLNRKQQQTQNSGEKEATNTSTTEVDISEQLSKELEDMKNESKKNLNERRFQAVETGASNCVFIKTNLPKPEEITSAVFEELLQTKVAKTRFLLRILPIMATCKANLLDITQTGGKLFDEHFLKEPSTFSIVFNKRFHNKLSRDDVIKELADLITLKNINNKADLKNPKKAVIVEIIKGICLMSVVENYYLYRKFNMFEVCKKDENTAGDDSTDKDTGDGESVKNEEEISNNEGGDKNPQSADREMEDAKSG